MNMTSDMTLQRVTSVDDGTEKAAKDWVDRIRRIPLQMSEKTKIEAHLIIYDSHCRLTSLV